MFSLAKFGYRKKNKEERDVTLLVLEEDEAYMKGVDFEKLSPGMQIQILDALSELNKRISFAISEEKAFRSLLKSGIYTEIEREIVE